MAEKFFLFKRKDPSVSGGALFSDSGKGISVVSLPAKNVAYMTATRGGVTIFFNNSSPFEESNITAVGESFEKTSVSVSCEIGEESKLMEDIINFINRDTAKNVMKFDATGIDNTFGVKDSKPQIDTRVRAFPVERGLTGTKAISNTPIELRNAVGNVSKGKAVNTQIDFLRPENKPLFDIGAEDLNSSITEGSAVTTSSGITNRGTQADFPDISFSNVICKENINACKTRAFGFDVTESLKIKDLVGATTLTAGSAVEASQTDKPSVATIIVRPGVGGISDDVSVPRFTYTTDGGSNVTALKVTYGGNNLKVGDQIIIAFDAAEANDTVAFTVEADEIGGSSLVNRAGISFGPESLFRAVTIEPSQPYTEHTVYMVLVRPNGALLNPVYSGILSTSNSNTDVFSPCMGPFEPESRETKFELNYNESNENPLLGKRALKLDATETVSNFRKKNSQTENPEDNLVVLVVRRDINNNIFIYDKNGEVVAEKEASEETDGFLFLRSVGMVLPFEANQPQLRVARFGFTNKDIGDDTCRSIATQLKDKYTP
jgi:hypothetical protein